MRKPIFFLLAITSSFGFGPDDDFVSTIKQKADNYFAKTNRAKLELVFNQPRYAPGDTAFIRTVYVRAADLKPVSGTQVVHLCLFDQKGIKKLTRWYSVTNGTAATELAIPENLTPGNYTLVAFTDWMKNMNQALFFHQEFTVSGKNLFSPAPHDTLEFYAEGGQLVAGVENNVAIRYTGQKDEITTVIRDSGKEIASLNLTKDKVAVFKMVPTANDPYYAELSGKKFFLPSVTTSGIALHADISNQQVTLKLEKTGNENPELYLFAFNGTGLISQNRLDFGGENKKEITLQSNVSNSVTQVVIVDSKNKIWASRVLYLDANSNYSVTISNPVSSFATRQPALFNLQIKNQEGYAAGGQFTCRVVNSDLLQSGDQKMDYLRFRSDLSNTFELKKEHASPVGINNYLITQSCPWFDWARITAKELTLSNKPQEYLILSGKAIYAKNSQPVRDSTLIMLYLEKNLSGYETYAHSKGQFSFPLVLNVSSSDRFFYTAAFKGNDTDEIIVKLTDPDSLVSFKAQPVNTEEGQDPYFVYRTQRNAINNSYSFFVNPKALSDSTFDPNKAIEDELTGVDATVRLSDYLQMPSMEEVLKEIMRAVEYRKINGRHVVRVYTTAKRPNNHTGPLYVIDGQITKNPEMFLSLKPADVLTIKLVKDSRKLFALGQLGSNGVIIVRTKKYIKIQERSMIDFSGLLPESRDWSKRKYDLKLPDLRACLYWTPLIQVNAGGSAEIKFPTSDDVGNFKLQVYGVTEGGSPFYQELPFDVKYQGN